LFSSWLVLININFYTKPKGRKSWDTICNTNGTCREERYKNKQE